MATIRSTLSLSVDSLIQVKIRAKNERGYGDYSQLNVAGAYVENIPSQVSTPTFDITTSTDTQITLTWTGLTGANKGGSSVTLTRYEIWWTSVSSSNTFTLLTTTTSSTTSYTKTGLTPGITYFFKVGAVNDYGDGPLSSYASLVASTIPSQPSAPTVSI
jgi:hypothetical protein